jgi:hypothetical protein
MGHEVLVDSHLWSNLAYSSPQARRNAAQDSGLSQHL